MSEIRSKYHFQATPKLVLFSNDERSLLLAKRKGENDYDGVFSFIGGKIETTDGDLVRGIKREKDEEVGEGFEVEIFVEMNHMFYFLKKDGNVLLVPHFYCRHLRGDIELNKKEYSESCWVKISDLEKFEPKIPNIEEISRKMLEMKNGITQKESFIKI